MFSNKYIAHRTFSQISDLYVQYRMEYPDEIFNWIHSMSINGSKSKVLELGAGSGQATIGIARKFDCVVAVDASSKQLEKAPVIENVQYIEMDINNLNLPEKKFDVVISACGAHWFEPDKYIALVNKHCNPGALICYFTYTYPNSDNFYAKKALNEVFEIIGNKWSKESLLHINKYKDLVFPYKSFCKTPNLVINVTWSKDHLYHFLKSWACIDKYIQSYANDFREKFISIFEDVPEDVTYKFPIYIKAAYL